MRRGGFTLIEAVAVIAILGIVSLISSDMILRVYQNYIRSNAVNTLQSRTESALEQISSRLSYRIKGLSRIDEGSDDNITWTGYDYEGFLGGGWSGFCDLNESNDTHIVSPDSNFTYADNVIATLSDGSLGLNDAVIYFKDTNLTHYDINSHDAGSLDISSAGIISEQYYISWSDYELFVTDDRNLSLRWRSGESVLLENVSRFKVKKIGQVIRIKLCVRSESLQEDFDFCKEKAVF